MFDLTGKSALVTGGGQGIGAGVAWYLARQGARVVVNDFYEDRARATADAIVADGFEASPLAFDVTDRDAVVAHIRPLDLDIVVNNAGNAGANAMKPSPFRDMDPQGWAPAIDVNLGGVMNTTHAVLKGMCDRRFGRLITISSGAGVVGLPIGVAPYGAGKAGATSFMRHMAIENARLGVTANSIALGLMEMTEVTDEALVSRLSKTVPVGRLGTGDDLGPAVVWLASDEASFVTGQTIHVNGGGITT
jgi:NAD(P)-dependent dehydrogenase (short-subunit alcohol dehydrogenase family)